MGNKHSAISVATADFFFLKRLVLFAYVFVCVYDVYIHVLVTGIREGVRPPRVGVSGGFGAQTQLLWESSKGFYDWDSTFA